MFDIRPCFRKDLTSDLVNLQDNKGNSPLLVCAIKNSRDTLRLIFLLYWLFSLAKSQFKYQKALIPTLIPILLLQNNLCQNNTKTKFQNIVSFRKKVFNADFKDF